MKKNLLIKLFAIWALIVNLSQSVPLGRDLAYGGEISFDDLYLDIRDIKAKAETSATPAPVEVSETPAVPPAAAPAAPQEREWLMAVFINGRNDLARAALKDVNEMETIGSTDKVGIAVELGLINDRGNSARYFIQKDTEPFKITSPAIRKTNTDMGSWKYFADFVKWSARTYPAKKHLVILWNHGSGRIDIGGADNTGAELGISYDDITKNFIRNKQLGLGLREISAALGKKLEIYSSDACLMQMAAVAYEIKDYADYLVQSEEIVPGAGFPYDAILEALNDNPQAGAEDVSKIIVDKFYDYYNSTSKKTTISTIKTSQFPSFISTLNDWVKVASGKSSRKLVLDSITSAVSFEKGYDGPDTSKNARSKDLYDFIDIINLLKADKNSEIYKKGEALKTFIDGTLVIHNKTTNGMVRAKGLAAYFPKMIYDSSYDEMLFARDSLWDDFLKWTLDGNYKVK